MVCLCVQAYFITVYFFSTTTSVALLNEQDAVMTEANREVRVEFLCSVVIGSVC